MSKDQLPGFPRIFYDLNILYANGAVDVYVVEGGRDSMGFDDKTGNMLLRLKPDEHTVEEVCILMQHVARVSKVQRTVPLEPQHVRFDG